MPLRNVPIILGLLLLAACDTIPAYQARTGNGVVQDVRRSPGDDPRRVAQTGGQYPAGYFYWVRMEDGTVQTIQQLSGAVSKGDRVRVTPEGRLEKLSE